MTLSTTSSSAPASVQVNVVGADLCAIVCAGSAGVHAGLVPPHAGESAALAVAFGAAALGLALAAAALALRPAPAVSGLTALLLLVVAWAYLLSRTAGLPGVSSHIEPFDILGAVVSCLEVAAAVVAIRPLIARRS